MKLTFWGVRGSIPTPMSSVELQEKIYHALVGSSGLNLQNSEAIRNYIQALHWNIKEVVGGNTTCMEIQSLHGEEYIIDAGSGIRTLGNELMKRQKGKVAAKIFISHDHWDHIQGFPFFVPAYVPGCTIEVYSGDKGLLRKLEKQHQQSDTAFIKKKQLEERIFEGNTSISNKEMRTNHTKEVFRGQQDVEKGYFPISIEQMNSSISFRDLKQYETVKNGLDVNYMFHTAHPGGMFSYKFLENGKRIVFAGDYERDGERKDSFGLNDRKMIDWAKNADILILDAQYTSEEYAGKRGWGHSELEGANYLAGAANVKALYLTHHDPLHDDFKLSAMEEHACAHMKEHIGNIPVYLAREGMSVEV